MNRSFFIMFFMYFFVVQSVIFGAVRGEPKFYIIGIINLIFIVLMALFYKNFDQSPHAGGQKDVSEELKAEHIVHKYHAALYASRQHTINATSYLFVISIVLLFLIVLDKAFLNIIPVSIWRFAGFYFVMLFLSAKKLLDKKIIIGDTIFLPKDFLFWTSLIVVIGVYGTLTLQVLAFKLFFAACVGFIFFFIGASIVKEVGSSNIFKLFFTRFYLVLMAVFIFIVGVLSLSSNYQQKLTSDRGSIQSLFINGFPFTRVQQVGLEDAFTGTDLLSNSTGQVLSMSLSTGTDTSYPAVLPTGDVSSDVVISSGSEDTSLAVAPVEDDRLSVSTSPTLMDIVIYLMNHYNVSLSSQTNLTFTYVTPKNPYYSQFRTAYDMKLINKDANPSKRVLCQTYMMMKGTIEEWNATNSSSSTALTYRNEAVSKGVLNGCKWNFYVKNVNL